MRRVWLLVVGAILASGCAILLDPDDYRDPAGGVAAAGTGASAAAGTSGSGTTGGGGAGAAGGAPACASDKTNLEAAWIHAIAGGNSAEGLLDVAIDAADNVYLIGTCAGAPLLDGMGTLQNCSAPGAYLLVVQIKSDGTVGWAQRVDGDSVHTDRAAIAVDLQGGVRITGGFGDASGGSVVIGTCPQKTSIGNSDVFVAKLDPKGHCSWLEQFGGSGADYATDIVALVGGHVAIVGRFDGAMTIKDGLNAKGGMFDTFVARIDEQGTPIWGRTLGGGVDDTRLRAAFDGTSLFVAGSFADTIDCCGTVAGGGPKDIFAASLDQDSHMVLAKAVFGGGGEERVLDLAVDGTGAPTVLATFTSDVLDLGIAKPASSGKNEVLVLGLHPDMTPSYALDLDGNAQEGGLALDPATREATFAVSSTDPLLGASGGGDPTVYAGRIGCGGDRRWIQGFGQPGANQQAVAVATASEGWLAIGGTVTGEVQFGSGFGVMAGAASDGFVVRFDPPR